MINHFLRFGKNDSLPSSRDTFQHPWGRYANYKPKTPTPLPPPVDLPELHRKSLARAGRSDANRTESYLSIDSLPRGYKRAVSAALGRGVRPAELLEVINQPIIARWFAQKHSGK